MREREREITQHTIYEREREREREREITQHTIYKREREKKIT